MRFSLFFKIFFLTTLMSGCESNTSFNDEDLNINGEDISDIFILEDNLSNSLESSYSFIALGDSYTIGEGVNENERWPNQFVDVNQRMVLILINQSLLLKQVGKHMIYLMQ